MGWADEFAEGFASGFVPTYTARMERQAQEDQDILKAKIGAAEDHLASRRELGAEDARRWRQASTIASSVGKGDAALAYRLLSTYEDPDTVTDMLRENPVQSLEQQTDAAVPSPMDQNTSSSADPDNFNTESFRNSMRMSESSGQENVMRTNQDGRSYAGLVQMGPERLEDYNRETGANLTPEQYRNLNEQDQRAIEDWHFRNINQQITNSEMSDYVGRNIGGIDITREGIVAMAHLGGVDGARRFLESGGQYNPSDELGTRLSDYASRFGRQSNTPADGQTDAMLAEEGEVSSEKQAIPDNAFTTLMGWNDNARERAVDSRFRSYLEDTGQLGAFEASRATPATSADPQSNFRLDMSAGGAVDLDDIIGKSSAEIDQFLIVNDASLGPQDRERIAAIREVAVQDEQDSNWWRSPEEISGKSSDFLRTFVALTDNEDARNQSLQALEARSRNDVPTSAKDAAFTEYWTSLPDEMSSTDRGQAAIDFENTWSSATNVGGQMDIFAELAERDSPAELTALRTVVNNDPSLADNREQFIGLIDTAISNQNAISDGGYTMDDYRGDLVRFTKDLTTGSEEERQAAAEWFATEQPGIVAGLKAAEDSQLDIEASSLEAAGVPPEVARLAATDSLDFRADRFGRLGVYNKTTGDLISTTGSVQSGGGNQGETPSAPDVSAVVPDPETVSGMSDAELRQMIENETAEFEEANGGNDIASFERTLANIDVSAALGGPGAVQSGVNTFAALFGANAPFDENRRAGNALERLQRITSLTLAQSQANQRGSVALMNEFRQNAVAPNEIIGLDGALDKFQANYALLNDQVQRLDRVRSGQIDATTADVSRANQVYDQISNLRDYYGVLVDNIENSTPNVSGQNFITGEGGNTPPPEQTEEAAPTPSGGAARRNRRNQSQSQQERQSQQEAINEARNAISQGADPAAVRDRLIENGYDASGL